MARLYLRPVGLLYGQAADAALAETLALPLCGGGIAFTAAEIVQGEPGKAKRQMMLARGLAAVKDADVRARLECITAKRAPFAGLSLDRPVLMGVVNVTPDSFSDGGLYDTTELAIAHAAELSAAGADIVDIGGESTRPGAEAVEIEEELQRVVPVIAGVGGMKAVVSIDTRKSKVAREAAKKGARILNDVSALTYDPETLRVVAETGMSVVLMHAKGDPKTMQQNPTYADVVLEVFDYLQGRIEVCEAAGISRDRIAADPGIGFGKTLDHNLALLSGLSLFHGLGVPLLVGASRKRFIAGVAGEDDPRRREPGSYAAAIVALGQGAQILRVHDVAGSRQALAVCQAGLAGRKC